MGFGSYDESDRRDPEITTEEGDGEDADLHENDYEGAVSYESGASTDDLVAGLERIKEEREEE